MGNAKKSTIQVGLYSIAVKLEVAVDSESSDTHTVCTGKGTHEPTRVKNHVDCPFAGCGESHSSVWGYPERGVETDGKVVVLTAEEIAAANGDPIKVLNLGFHSREKVYAATVAGDSVQNVSPDKGGERGYQALVETLRARPEVVAVTVWAPSSKNALWTVEVVDGHLVASKRAWPETVRVAPAIAPAEVTEQELDMFGQYVDVTLSDFDLGTYSDAAKDGMAALLASRSETAITVAAAPGAPVTSGDMLAALQASVKAAKPAKKAPAKKRASRAKKAA